MNVLKWFFRERFSWFEVFVIFFMLAFFAGDWGIVFLISMVTGCASVYIQRKLGISRVA